MLPNALRRNLDGRILVDIVTKERVEDRTAL